MNHLRRCLVFLLLVMKDLEQLAQEQDREDARQAMLVQARSHTAQLTVYVIVF